MAGRGSGAQRRPDSPRLDQPETREVKEFGNSRYARTLMNQNGAPLTQGRTTMLRTIGLCMLAVLAVGTTLRTPVSGQENERDTGRTKRFDAACAQMDEIAKAIQEKVKGFRAAEEQAGTMTRSKIDAFHEEIQKLYDELDKPREEIDKLHEEIQAQFERAMEQCEQAMDAYTQVSDEYDDAIEMYEDAMDEISDTMEDSEEADGAGTTDSDDDERRLTVRSSPYLRTWRCKLVHRWSCSETLNSKSARR